MLSITGKDRIRRHGKEGGRSRRRAPDLASIHVDSRILGFALVGLLLLAPLPLGSNRPWSWSLLALLVAFVFLAGALVKTDRAGEARFARAVPLAARGCFLGVCCWAFIQSLPLGLTSLAHPGWQRLAAVGLETTSLIGLDANGTREALMRLMSYGAVFWLASRLALDRARALFMSCGVIAIATIFAFYGLANHFLGLEWIVPGVPRQSIARLQSTFINPNNFATYANIALVSAIAFAASPLFSRDNAGRAGFRLTANAVASPRVAFLSLAIPVLAFASLLTGSRGGLLSLAGTLVFFSLLVVFRAGNPLWIRLLVPAGLFALFGGVLVVSGDYSLARLGRGLGIGDTRLAMYDITLHMIADRPWLGHGYGNFEAAFLAYRDGRLPLLVDKAHNTYLEHMAELGLPATLLLYSGIAIILARIISGFRNRRRDRVFALAALLSAMVAGLHSLVDFSLQIPAVAVTFATVLGIGAAQSVSSRTPVVILDAGGDGQRNQRSQPAS